VLQKCKVNIVLG